MLFKANKTQLIVTSAFVSILLFGCATYYQKNLQLQGYIKSGDFANANKQLNKDKKGEVGVNRVLYFMNKGLVNFMIGEHEISNSFFDKADLYTEDYKNSIGNEALALISNPMVKPYKPEDFEAVMVHYYKSLNYLFLNNYEDALVECKRMNIQLQMLNDKYKKTKNKYANDAFAHNLMGMIYDAAGDKNNAFIAYRNAYETYENEYKKLFNLSSPDQLKKDLLRTAYQTGFMDDYDFYSRKFNMSYESNNSNNGSLVFLWMNGFSPVKAEWSINFINAGYNDGWVTFANEENGFSFPIFIGNRNNDEQNAFKNLSFLRVAFPKYVERKPIFSSASLLTNDSIYQLELSENINAIAFQSLHDRMARELAYGIARLATKKAMEELANSKDKNMGTVLSIINALTEKADTRNWQSLPYAIHYARIPLPEGNHKVSLQLNNDQSTHQSFSFDIKKNKTTFFSYHQLESSF